MNPFSQKTFADSLQLPFPLLSDFPKMKVIKEYGVVHIAGIMANGAMFLVDAQGTIRARWLPELDTGEVFPVEPLLEAAKAVAKAG